MDETTGKSGRRDGGCGWPGCCVALVVALVSGLAAAPGAELPGVLQAEDFDPGAAGVAYHDLTPGNLGGRHRAGDVDLYDNGSGGVHVGYTEPGEWLAFTVTVASGFDCTLRYRVASGTGATINVRVEVDGVTRDVLATPGTGGYTNWKDVATHVPFPLSAGTHLVRVAFPSGDLNLDEIEFLPAAGPAPPYLDPARPVSERVEDLLGRMTIAEKVGQTILIDRRFLGANELDIRNFTIGGVFSGGGSAPSPNTLTAWADMADRFQAFGRSARLAIPVLVGADAVHGHNNLKDATVFPHNVGLGAADDPHLVERVARAVAVECAASGVRWTFSPSVSVARDPRWGRTYESFGESPDRVVPMAAAVVRGLHGPDLSAPTGVLAAAKHFVGDGGASWGSGMEGKIDRGDARIDESELRSVHLAPFEAAVAAGCRSVMAAFSRWNGGRLHGHRYLLTDVLKGELGFSGFVLSDWGGIDALAGDYRSAISAAIGAGVDMVMVPDRYPTYSAECQAAVGSGAIAGARLDDAVRRILTVKFELGLFERPWTDRSLMPQVRSDAHLALAREAVARSAVVLENTGDLLPLAQGFLSRVHVAGRHAADIGLQCGGWTVSWQGGSGPTTAGTTILDGIRAAAGAGTAVTFSAEGSGAAGADVAIAVVGEEPYAEFLGDSADLSLSAAAGATIGRLRSAGVPVVVVLVAGRPLLIDPDVSNWDALVVAWLPGSEGHGVADVLFGHAPGTGTLPQTWPRSTNPLPLNAGDSPYDPLYAYGFGLAEAPGPVSLSIRRDAGGVVLAWSAGEGSGLVLQRSEGSYGDAAAWGDVAEPPVRVGEFFEFTEPPQTGAPVFFRLARP